jgi:hypothetical protein
MRYGSTTKGTTFRPPGPGQKVVRSLLSFVPAASPDHEKLYPLVKRWVLEVTDAGLPNREVGLGEGDRALFRAPEGRNMGMWTDSPMVFGDDDLEPITAAQFEALWSAAEVHGDA